MSVRIDDAPAGPDAAPPAVGAGSVQGGVGTSVEGRPAGASARVLWRAARVPLVLLVVLVLVATVVALVQGRYRRGRLDPDAVDAQGSRALARLARDRGLEVTRVRRVADALDGADAGTTVVVVRAERLSDAEVRDIGAYEGAADLVLVEPTPELLAAVTRDVRVAKTGSPVEAREPACDLPAAANAGVADLGGVTFRLQGGGAACYAAGGDPTLVQAGNGVGGTVTVLGSGDPLTNDRLDERGNAALGLGLLGAGTGTSAVRWLLPGTGAAGAGGDTALVDLLPDGLVGALRQLLVAFVLLVLWRSRRLGPPVREPLPVVVRAAETVEGRARLYRRARARDRAADALRAGARARLAPALGVGRDPAPAALVTAAAERSGRSPQQVAALLGGPPPRDDAALVRLAGELDALTRSVLDREVPPR